MSKFKDLGVSDSLVEALKKQGIKTPTPIQNMCIPKIYDNFDVIGEAQTGTGKTLAFLLPIFDNLDPSDLSTQVLILSPTRELAIQITEVAKKLSVVKEINILAAYGGQDIQSQLNKLTKGVQMIIATPGRLLDHIGRGSIDLSRLSYLVLDEADQMLHLGFRNEVDLIISYTNKTKQTLCFSATIDSKVKKLAYKTMKNPLVLQVEKESIILDSISQLVIETTDRKKQAALCQLLNEDNPFMSIIFCRTKRRVDKLEEELHMKGYNVQKLHGDITQSKREKIMKSFKNAEIQYLIATDVASRGLDISGVSHVYNYDIPEDPESYVHRIGRTGRAGGSGFSYIFVAPKDLEYLRAIEESIKHKIPKRAIEVNDDIRSNQDMTKANKKKRINAYSKNDFNKKTSSSKLRKEKSK